MSAAALATGLAVVALLAAMAAATGLMLERPDERPQPLRALRPTARGKVR